MNILILSFLLVSTIAHAETDWYVAQAGGLDNSGTSVTAMAIRWVSQVEYKFRDAQVEIGYIPRNKYVTFDNMMKVFDNHYVNCLVIGIEKLSSLRDLIELKDIIVIVMINPMDIEKSVGDKYGRLYDYAGGPRYVILEDIESEYFIVQDPWPGSKDRRYLVEQVWEAMQDKLAVDKRIIVIRNIYGVKDYN
jgi:hypothetical protein